MSSAPDELLHQMSDSTASFIFIQPPLLHTLDAALATAKSSGSEYTINKDRIILLCPKDSKPANSPYKSVEELWVKDNQSQIPPLTLAKGEESNTAYLCYSSGTTGRAKGVETTHHNMTSQVQAVNLVMEPLEAGKDRCLGILPFSHIYGLTLLIHWTLTVGVPIIVLPRFDEIQVLKVIQEHKITFGYVVPPVLIVLLNSKNVPNYDISSLKGVMSGAAPLSADLAHAVQDKLNFGVTQGYGLTETSPVSHVMTLQESLGRKGRIGKLMPTYQARLVTEDGKDVIKQGERGELWVRGPSVMKGYWKNEDATKNTFAEGGWFMTGDVAEVDPEGYFAIVDRVKELIKYKGFQGTSLLLSSPQSQLRLTSSPTSRTRGPTPDPPQSSRRSSHRLPLPIRSYRTPTRLCRTQSRPGSIHQQKR
jgi:long-subunit acyl-CoA synthetase (AMP-forming)